MKILIQTGRMIFRFIIPPVVIGLGLFNHLALNSPLWAEHVYILLLASMVGYFTNFIAIKMLFHPRRKTVFGRQGLIPKNQERIAETLGQSIADSFFSAQDLLRYIEKNRLAHTALDSLWSEIRTRLQDPDTRIRISGWIADRIRNHTRELEELTADLSESAISRLIANPPDLKKGAVFLSRFIERQIREGTLDLENLTETLAGLIHSRVPQIAQVISRAIKEYIDSQSPLTKGTLKFARMVARIDEPRIQRILYDNLSSPAFRQQVYGILTGAASRFALYLQSDSGTSQVNRMAQRGLVFLKQSVRDKAVPGLVNRVENALREEDSWETVSKVLDKSFFFLHREMDRWIRSPGFRSHLEKLLTWILGQVHVSFLVKDKIQSFNISELEALVLSVSGQELGAIEVLGGILGAVTGLALFNLRWFFILVSCLVLAAGFEFILTRFSRREDNLS